MNYIGSKYSLLNFLQSTIKEVTQYGDNNGFVFADLFAGTGIVGATYRAKGCKVISNDIQYYSYVLNKHYIESTVPPNDDIINHIKNLNGTKGFIYNNYCIESGSSRNYFESNNGKKCDAIRLELDILLQNNVIDTQTYFSLLASLINSIDKYANTTSVYGAFLKHLKNSAQKPFELEIIPTVDGPRGEVYNEDVNVLIKRISGDVLYLDPPYNERQYCTNYHVLETVAKYDNPVLNGKTGLRNYKDQKSKYCSKKTVNDTFEDLISNANFKYIFLSYNNEGLMSLDKIKEIMSKYGTYCFYTQNYRRFKADKNSNRTISSEVTTEYLHCLVKDF